MKKTQVILFSTLFCYLVLGAFTGSLYAFDHSHSQWTKVLVKHLNNGRFNYRALKGNPDNINEYLEQHPPTDFTFVTLGPKELTLPEA